MIRRPPRSTQGVSSAASDVYKRQARASPCSDLPINIRHELERLDLTSFGRVGTSRSFHSNLFSGVCVHSNYKKKSWNSCELSAIGNILDCQYTTLVTHRLQVGCLEHTHAPLPPLLFPFSRHDYSAARTHAVPWGGEGGSGPEACLLYTSPSPRDKRQSRMPSSA